MVERNLAESREKAQAMIMAGLVYCGQRRIEKPGQLVSPDIEITVRESLPYVGRGGLKLEEALGAFRIDVSGKICADIGASTGGFTDCLLKRRAAKVYAVDVDTRQIDSRLREDPRVVLIEKNARYLTAGDFPQPVDLITMDVSFISILKILPAITAVLEHFRSAMPATGRPLPGKLLSPSVPAKEKGGFIHDLEPSFKPDENPPLSARETKDFVSALKSGIGRSAVGGQLLALIKPQFEAGKGRVGKKGIVRDPSLRREVLEKVVHEVSLLGFRLRGLLRCSTRGKTGNVEFFGCWSVEGLHPPWDTVLQWIKEVTRDEKG